MFVNVIQMQFKPGSLLEARRLWNESLLPVLQCLAGWKDASFAPTCSDKALLFTLWETEEAARGFGHSREYQRELAKLTSLGQGEMTTVVYRLGTAEEELLAHCKRPTPNHN
jgi:hypothetical protein